jgi:epsilon-lactone hydrolase
LQLIVPSLRARFFSSTIKLLVRRRHWGDETRLARRARRIFGLHPALQGFYARGVDIRKLSAGSIKGEWLVPRASREGALLYFHGGGYVSCSPRTHRPITTRLAKLTRLPVLALDYRLAPEHRFPAALDDAVAAYLWLIESRGIDPRKVVLAGDSAGGGLAISTLIRLRDSGKPVPAAAVCFSPWTDMSGSSTSAVSNEGKCAMFRVENIVDFSKAYLGDVPPTNPEASPLFADLRGLPPVLLHVGSTELLLDDSVRLHERILEAGGASTLEVFDDVPHAWQMLDGFVPESRRSLEMVARFIEARTSHKPLATSATLQSGRVLL